MLLLLQIFLFTVFKKKKLAADHDLWFWQVIIKFGDREINKSPFSVKVEGAAGDPTKVTASGPGLEKTGVIATKRTYFEVFTKSEFILCLAVYVWVFFNKNKVSVEIFKDHYSENVSCYAILWFIHQVSCFYLTYEFSIQKKKCQSKGVNSIMIHVHLSLNIYLFMECDTMSW